MAKQLNVNLAFTADTGRAKAQLQDLQNALNKLTSMSESNGNGLGISKDIAQATNEVAKLKAILESSKSATGGLDLGKFNQSIKEGEMSLSKYANTLSSLGPAGDQAFAKLAKSIVTAEIPLKRTNSVLEQFATTLKNTARWQISSSVLHGFMGSVQSAYSYAERLNESLNQIRIVTGQNTDQMAKFAEQANKAAKTLSTTTTNYTNASLIYYQQGLSDQEVQDRTDITIKMANAANQSAEIVSDQLTAVWNNFYDGSQSLEHYADAMTRLGADTASSTDEIAEGLEKFASVADLIGLSFDNAAAALATVTATTRQSADIVGTAFKTIFARIQGLNLGETLDDGTDLNKYSKALETVGINIKDQNGELKDMDTILDEMGSKWKTLSKDQQTALAQTVAGVRQYTQLVSLMDNWDFYQKNLESAKNSDGSLQEQADIYAESWEAAQKRVRAAAEEIYHQLLNDDFFIELNNGFAKFLGIVSNTIDTLGGLPGILTVATSLMFKLFGKDMASTIDNWGYNIKLRSKEGLQSILEFRQQAVETLKTMYANNVDTGPVNSASQQVFTSQANLVDELLIKEQELLAKGTALTEEDKQQAQYMIQITEQLGEQSIKAAEQLQLAQRNGDELESQLQIQLRRYNNGHPENKINISKELAQVKQQQIQYSSLEATFKKLTASKKSFSSSDEIIQELTKMTTAAEDAGLDFSHFKEVIASLSSNMSVDEALNVIEQKMYDIGDSAYNAIEGTNGLRQTLTGIGLTSQQVDSILDSLYTSWVQQGIITEEVAQKLKQVSANAEDAGNKIRNMQGPPPKLGSQLVAVGNTLSNIAMSINMIKGLFDTWNNEDLSFGEKLISTFTTLGMVIPIVTNAFSKNNIVTLGAASTSLLAAARFDTAGRAALIAAGGVNSLWAALWPIAVVAAAVAAAIAVLVLTIKALSNAYNADSIAAEKAEESARNLAEAYNEAKTEYEDMISAMENYQSARDGLDSLTKGTEDYSSALKEANRLALELINKYGLISDQDYEWQGDELIVHDDTLRRIQKEKESDADQAYAASQMSNVNAKRARNISNQTDLIREVQDQNGVGTNDRVLGGIMNVISAALGVVLAPVTQGLSLVATGLAINNSVNADIRASELDAAITAATKEYRDNTNLFDTKKALAEGLNLNDEELINALWDNKDAIISLGNDMNAAEAAFELAAQNSANEIMSNSGYSNTKAGSMALEAGGEIYAQKQTEAYQAYLDTEMANFWGRTQEGKAMWARYAKEKGLDQLDGYEVTNYRKDGSVEYKYIDESGQEQEAIATKEMIAEVLAASDAAKDLEEALSQLRDKIAELNASDDISDQALADFLSTGNLEGSTNAEFEALKSRVETEGIDSILGLTGNAESDLALAKSYGYESAEAYRQAFEDALNIEWKIPKGLEDIADSLTLGASEKISSTFEKMGEEGSQAYIDTLKTINEAVDWSALTPEETETAWNQLASIDWSSWDAGQQAVQIVEDLGGEIDTTTDSWKENISTMRDAMDVLPDLTSIKTTMSEIQKIVDDLEIGAILSAEDYKTLVSYNKELEKYFTILSDGSAQMIGDPLDLQQEIRETNRQDLIEAAEAYQKEADELQAQFDAGVRAIGGDKNNIDQYRDTENYINGNGENKYSGANVQTQLEFLKSQNYDADQISNWQSDLADGNTTTEVLEDIAAAVDKTSESFLASENTLEGYKESLQQVRNELALGAKDAQEAQELLNKGLINEDAYNYSAIARHNEDKWADMDPSEVEDYADALQSAAKESNLLSDELEDNAEAAEDVALYTKRMNKGIDALADGFEDWSDVLKKSDKASEEYCDAMNDIKDAMSDVLGVSKDFLSDDFILNNMEDIEKAATGDAEAIDRLALAAARDILINISLNDEELQQQLLTLHDNLINLIPTEIKVGATLDTEEFQAAAQGLIDAAGMTVDEAQAYFNSLGYEPEFIMENKVETAPMYGKRVYTDEPVIGSVPDGNGGEYQYVKSMLTHEEQEYMGEHEQNFVVPAMSANGTPKIKSVTKVSSGAMNNYSKTNSGGKSPGKSSGGGGSKNKVKKPDKTQLVERYKEITDAINDNTRAMDKASKAADRLYGKNRIDYLKQQNALLKEQKGLLEQKKSEAEDYLSKDRAELEKAAQAAGINLNIDSNNNISNYTSEMQKLEDQMNALIDQVYADSEVSDDEQEKIDELQDKIDALTKAIDQYEETRDLVHDLEDQIQDAYYEWQDNNYEILHYELEIKIEINDLELEKIDYYINKLSDDFYSMAEVAGYMNQKFSEAQDALGYYEGFYNDLNAAFANGEISQEKYVEGLKESYSAILDQLTSLNDLDKEMMHYYEDTLDAAADELSYYTDQLEHLNSVLDHYKNLVTLVNGELDYKSIGKILDGQAKVLKNQLDVASANYKMLLSEKAEIEQSLANAQDEAARELFEKELKAITTKVNEAQEEMLSKTEEWAKAQKAIMENAMAEAAKAMEKEFTDGLGFDALSNSIDRLNSYADEYLTKTNQIYETQKLINTAQQAADKTTNEAAKARLNSYMKEVETLQEKNQLSNLELEIAKAKYDVVLAEIALEEAQNAKSTVRLQRDNEGNFGYVYTANQDDVSKAEQDLADAQNRLYNIGLEGTNEYGQKLLELQQKLADDLVALEEARAAGQYATDEEYYAARDQLISEYNDLFRAYSEQYTTAMGVDANIQQEAWINAYESMINKTGEWQDKTSTYIEKCEESYSSWRQVVEDESEIIDGILNDLESEVDDVTKSSDELYEEVKNKIVPGLKDELVAVRNVTSAYAAQRQQIQELISYYERLTQSILAAIRAQSGLNGSSGSSEVDYSQDFSSKMAEAWEQGDMEAYEKWKQLREEKIAAGYSDWGVSTDWINDYLKNGGELPDGMTWVDLYKQLNGGFATGGFTGAWGPEGKLTFLHEKELVLNKDDTANFLTATNVLRDISDMIDLKALQDKVSILPYLPGVSTNGSGDTLEQTVTIEAHFPSVTSHNEIEEAFNTLVNRASQYANRK